jgi:TetR/AcrR family transcriptional repressor of nem operon
MPTSASSRRAPRSGTADQVLDVAERLLQERGYNGFSYADAAAELGITRAALHYHFAGKAELGTALIARYATRFADALAAIDASGADAQTKLAAYAELYASVLRDGRMCLCGMLAAEYQTLPAPMREAVTGFFDDNETWLTGVIEAGRRDGELRVTGSAHDAARLLVGGLEGAMLVARLRGDPARFDVSADQLLAAMA